MEGNAGYASFKKELKVTIYFMHVVGLYFHLLRLKSLPLHRGFTFKCRMVFRRRYRNLTTIEVNSFPAVSSAWWRGAHAIELGSAFALYRRVVKRKTLMVSDLAISLVVSVPCCSCTAIAVACTPGLLHQSSKGCRAKAVSA